MSQQLPQPYATPLAETDYFIGGASMTCNVYDLMYFDDTQLAPLNAASMPDQGTEAKNQRYFAQRFRGVSRDRRIAAEAADNANGPFSLGIFPDFTGIFSCPTNTFEVGDLVAVRENATTNGLQANVLTKTTDSDAAIGEVVQRTGLTPATQVVVRLRRPINPPARNMKEAPFGTLSENVATTTLTLKTSSRRFVPMTPGAAQTVIMPNEAASAGLDFILVNLSSANSVTVKDSFNSNTVCYINTMSGANVSSKLLHCDGVLGTWVPFPSKG